MSSPLTARAQSCPDCAGPLPSDPRFAVWCPACEWNLTPPVTTAQAPRQRWRAAWEKRRNAARERSVRTRTERVYELVASGTPMLRDGAWLAAAGLAGLIHLLTLGLFVGAILLLALGGTWPVRIAGGLLLALAVLLRPRIGRWKNGDGVLTRAEAPALHALAERVAAEVGSRPVDSIRLSGSFNASFGKAGFRRRTSLTIGLPLWEVLTPQQRVALLGHEFGHNVNGDHRRGLWLGSAVGALAEWCALTRPRTSAMGSARITVMAITSVVNLLLWTIHLSFYGLLVLLDRLTTRSSQAAEYQADALAAQVASSEAARDMLAALLLVTSFETVRNRRRSVSHRSGLPGTRIEPEQDFWTELAEQLASIPPLERERRLRLSERELGAVDRSHPPTHLRLRMLDLHPVAEPRVVLGENEAAAIEAELAPHRKAVARALTGR